LYPCGAFLEEESIQILSGTVEPIRVHHYKWWLNGRVKLLDGKKKKKVIENCIKNEWSTRKLDEAISKKLKENPSEKRVSLIRTTKKYIARIDSVIASVDESDLDCNHENLMKMKEKQRSTIKGHIEELKEKIKIASTTHETVLENCDKLLEELQKIDNGNTK